MAAAAFQSPQKHQTLEPFVETPHVDGHDGPLSVPYAVRVPIPPEAGQTLTVRGVVQPNAQRFEINLLNGVSSAQQLQWATIPRQIPLHLCFHFEVGISVLNSYQDGDWGYEEIHLNPFKAGAPFEVSIEIREDAFEVLANGKRLASYPHRVSYQSVDYIQVRGDIQLDGVNWSPPVGQD